MGSKKTEKADIPLINDRGILLNVTDGQFIDNHGNTVVHGSKILIEHNYNYPHFNNREAFVEWNPKKGMYYFVFVDDVRLKQRYDFWGVHSFKVIE